jgi:hypothetical protein
MKIYLVKRKRTNVKWFDNQEDLTNFLINAPERIDSYQIITIDGQIESEMAGDLVLTSIKEQTNLDTKLSITLGDEYSQKVNNLIDLYKKLCKKAPWDQTKMSPTAEKVYQKLIATPATEKDFKKISAANLEYLVYNVSNSVEWFKTLLEVFPKINKLSETCRMEYVDKLTYGTQWLGGRTPKEIVKNFEKAKSSMK